MSLIIETLSRRIRRAAELARLVTAAWMVSRASRPASDRQPVLFFNATTRLSGLSQNAGFSLLASWMVRLAGTPVVHFVCNSGMSRCVLGTDETDPVKPMPCKMCIRQSRLNFTGAPTRWFGFWRDEPLAAALQPLSLDELLRYELPLPDGSGTFPLGNIVIPSLRWRMRLQSLTDDEAIRFLCREFMLSAWNIAREFSACLDETQPRAAVLFNGTHFPEATAAWLCRQRGIRVVTHESGFQPFSGYFVEGQATMYPIVIPAVDLTPEQNARLDADLQKRWQGDFTMAGVRFWSEINGLPEHLTQKAAGFRQVVSVFTNVIFDTTQMYANIVFRDMFAWLDELLEVMRTNSQTLFILRAHPDEARPGKASRESVAMWFEQKAAALPNVAFIPPQERLSSYDLLKISKFVLTYNSTIGLEAILLGVPILAAGQAPFNAFDTVFFESRREKYLGQLNAWLAASRLEVSPERVRNTRRFIYYRTYRFSLPFGEFLESTQPTGYVRLKKFTPTQLAQSSTARALLGGLFDGKRFELDV
jgi:Capsule polysaccharide biosynthesis protein